MMFGSGKNVRICGLIALLSILSACAAFAVNPPPTLGTATPSSGNIQIGQWTTLTCTYSDLSGAADLWRCGLLINKTLTNTGAAHLIYSHKSKVFMMKNDLGVETNAVAKGTAANIETANATLDCGGTTVTAVGNTLTIVWRFKLKATMTGKACNLYMMATDIWSVAAPWASKGTAFANTAPTFGTPSPSTGTINAGTWTTVTCTYSDPNGADDLWTCNLLLNNTLTNVGGAHFMYSRNTNKLFLKNNVDALVGGIAPGTIASIETANAVLDCQNTLVTKSGNNLTITWRFKTKSPMNGKNCGMYLTAADNHGGTAPWVSKGTIRVNSAPLLVSVSPATGTTPSDVAVTFNSIYADPDGAVGIASCNLLLNTSVSNVGGAHFVYNENTNKLYMKNNAGALVPSLGVTLGAAEVINSENATLYCEDTTVSRIGNNLTVNWRIKLKPVMNAKVCNEYMTAMDDFGVVAAWTSKGTITVGSASVAQLIAAGKGALNSIVTMEPYNAADASALLTQAYGYFQKAKALDTNNAQANFGLAITDAAITSQGLVDKYKDTFETGESLASLNYALGSMQILNISKMVEPGKEPLGGLVTSYSDSIVHLASGPTPMQLSGMQADLKDVVRPMLARVAGYLNIVETYGGASFVFGIGPVGLDGYSIVDIGDVYLFHGGLLAAKWALAIPVSYSVNTGTYNWDLSPLERDLNHDGLLSAAEFLPASPFMSLIDSSTMTGAKADMIAAADKIVAGVNATLAETSDNYDLLAWHTPGEGPTQAELLAIKAYATSLKASMNAPTLITWDEDEGTKSIRVFLGAWNTNPPASLKSLYPTQEIVRWRNTGAQQYEYDVNDTENGFPDTTFGGIFPDGGPDFTDDLEVTIDTGYTGTLVGMTTYPANLATGISTELQGNIWVSFSGYPPATVSFTLQRYFAGAWRGVRVYPGWLDQYNRYHINVEKSLWPNSSYRMIITDVGAGQSVTKTFTTGADAPF